MSHARAVLSQLLCELYGLTRLERSAGFYLASGTLCGADMKTIRELVNQACAALSGDGGALALRLCEGFGIPEHLIAAPIARDWRSIVT